MVIGKHIIGSDLTRVASSPAGVDLNKARALQDVTSGCDMGLLGEQIVFSYQTRCNAVQVHSADGRKCGNNNQPNAPLPHRKSLEDEKQK